MSNVPQHPGNQQGLGPQQPQQQPNPYYKPNASLAAYNDDLTGQRQQELQQAGAQGAKQGFQEGAQAGVQKGIQQGYQAGLEQPQVSPQQVQSQQIAEALLTGAMTREALVQGVQSGQIDQAVAQQAEGMAQAQEASAIQQYQQEQQIQQAPGLGSLHQ